MANHLKKRRLYERLKERDGLTCGICKESLEAEWNLYQEWLAWANSKEPIRPKAPHKRSRLGLSIDHIYPKSRARRDGWEKWQTWDLSNLQLAHMSCNVKKADVWHEQNEQKKSPESGSIAPSVISPMDSLTAESHTGSMESDKKSASPAEPSASEKGGDSTPLTKKEILHQAMLQYNEAAKMWNSLPGPRLIWPKDKFAIKYCYCPGSDSKKKLVPDAKLGTHPVKVCWTCGYPLKGEYDD